MEAFRNDDKMKIYLQNIIKQRFETSKKIPKILSQLQNGIYSV